ncbi:hypothetical protein CKO35_12805 [Ectothiorhodospira shaposhnikovii]|uniref:hypothetical protein n=1 Tax=Ectothiorhodospira shaposhnikovii TaxID=1054 RepID=UPI0019050648|nr:hypothetical protein [Ectothiorhodospira shaposhnikovii]MBK1674167.1 hypothetical protein [Ectothiorhodospira shaposhnikovii]
MGYRLLDHHYILPTPAGAFYSVAGPEQDAPRLLLRRMLSGEMSPRLSLPELMRWTGTGTAEEALEMLYYVQSLGWVEGFATARQAPQGALESVLPGLLAPLSDNGKVLLADPQGFHVASVGFNHETTVELSAASADLATLYERHSGLLRHNMGLGTGAWALVDAAGNSRVGFWPLHIADQRFVLVIVGVPRLNQQALTELVWALLKRYAR